MLVRKTVAPCLSLLLVKKMILKKMWMSSKMIYLSKTSPQCFSWAKLQSNRLVDSDTGNNHNTLFPWCPIKSTVFFHRCPRVQNVVTLRMHTVVKTHHKIRHKPQQRTCRVNAKTSPSSRSCWTNFDGETHSLLKKKKLKTKGINRGSGMTSNSPVERGKITVFVSGVWWPWEQYNDGFWLNTKKKHATLHNA